MSGDFSGVVSVIKRVLGQVRKAIEEYDMIQEGDRIAVGVSGGKDSMTLLVALSHLQKFFPRKFELEAVTLTLGTGEMDFGPIKQLCAKLGVNHTVEETLIGKIVFEARSEKNPCSLCANMRRGALNNKAKELGCNKVALGHNRDDAIETLLLSLFFEGRINTFSTVTHLDRKDIYIIRPLIFLEEREIKGFVTSYGLQVVPSPCKMDKNTKRQFIKELILDIARQNKDVKSNIFGAIRRFGLDK